MDADQKVRPGKRSTNRLMRNGYTALSRVTLALARTGLVDPFTSAKCILPRRAITVVSALQPAVHTIRIQLSLATAYVNFERGAATVSVRFFTLLGRSVKMPDAKTTHRFFADAIDTVAPQNAYFEVPTGAKWVSVTIERSGARRRIGIFGSLRPKALEDDLNVSFEEALAGRDRKMLEAHLTKCREAQDRLQALQILERLIYLEKTETDQTLHRLISDVHETLAQVPARMAGDDADTIYDYNAPLVGAYSPKVPLSKWLKLEVKSLVKEAGGRHVHVSGSDAAGLQLLACLYAGLPFTIKDCERHRLASFHSWVFDSDFNEILAFNP